MGGESNEMDGPEEKSGSFFDLRLAGLGLDK